MTEADYFTLFGNGHVILLQPNKPNLPVLKITRPDARISIVPPGDFEVAAYGPFDRSFRCFGVFGMIELLAGKYLIVVTERSLVGVLPQREANVYQVTGFQIVPCGVDIRELSWARRTDETEFLRLLHATLHSAPMASGFYYSPTAELGRSLQAQLTTPLDCAQWKLDRKAMMFCANRAILADFTGLPQRSEIAGFVCSAIQGFVEIRDLIVEQSKICFILISRRNTSRTGARYHSRGVDQFGNVSNFVETEQLFFTSDGKCASYVQVRGSIPLYWRQNVRIKYKPELEISAPVEDPAVQRAFRLHRDALLKAYGRVQVANLVDLKGGEGQLARAFATLSKLDQASGSGSASNWRYYEFDFHHQCRNMAYHNIQNLINAIADELDMQSYFEAELEAGGKTFLVKRLQKGVVRTNCMDCLDRTNVVQSVLAKRALFMQLTDLGIVESSSGRGHSDAPKSVDALHPLSEVFRNVWADNADAISTQYSGTGALKTDFTRTGQRSLPGVLQDGVNSMLRYYFGNCTDGARQDGLDLLFGTYRVNKDAYASPFIYGSLEPMASLIIKALILAVALLFVFLRRGMWVGVVACALIVTGLAVYIRADGKRFAQYPRLHPPPFKLRHKSGSSSREKAYLLAKEN